jgi:hypothetical protein
LAYKLQSGSLLHVIKIMYVLTHALWEWYARQVENIKTPKDHLGYLLAMAGSKWRSPASLKAMLDKSLFTMRTLDYMEIPRGPGSSTACHIVWLATEASSDINAILNCTLLPWPLQTWVPRRMAGVSSCKQTNNQLALMMLVAPTHLFVAVACRRDGSLNVP